MSLYLTSTPTGTLLDRLSTEEKVKLLLSDLGRELGKSERDAAAWLAGRYGWQTRDLFALRGKAC